MVRSWFARRPPWLLAHWPPAWRPLRNWRHQTADSTVWCRQFAGGGSLAEVLFQVRQLVDAALVTAALERRLQPDLQDLVGQSRPHDAATHGQHVGVVVLARQPGREQVVAE